MATRPVKEPVPSLSRKSKLVTFSPTSLVPFFVGQSVRLRSGGPTMTVTGVLSQKHADGKLEMVDLRGRPLDRDGFALIGCTWFSLGANGGWVGPNNYEFVSTLLVAT